MVYRTGIYKNHMQMFANTAIWFSLPSIFCYFLSTFLGGVTMHESDFLTFFFFSSGFPSLSLYLVESAHGFLNIRSCVNLEFQQQPLYLLFP